MKSYRFLALSALCSAIICSGLWQANAQTVEYVQQPTVVYVQAPVVNIGTRHGQLRSAQGDIVNAYNKINQAQANNQYQLGGHAQRAKDLLSQADSELRQAANVSNSEGR